MNILAALRREERELEKHVTKFQHQLDGIRAAMKALGHSAAAANFALPKEAWGEG